jgi:hypothetical protein
MKSSLILLTAFALFMFASCRKTDLQQPNPIENNNNNADMSAWKTVNSWSASNAGRNDAYTGVISDNSITSEIADNGLVLVYTNDGNAVRQLPYSEQSEGKTYSWYYQVSEGRITVSVDANGDVSNLKLQQGFTYLKLSANQLEELESKGLSAAELFQISYDKALTGFDSK